MKPKEILKGVWDVGEIQTWDEFVKFIYKKFTNGKNKKRRLDPKDYAWRGEPKSDTPLTSSFDRKWYEKDDRNTMLKEHRQAFLYATRGRTDRLGMSIAELKHYVKSGTLNENHWWAFGQHYGLETPLLDWTTSPFVAAFFAFEKKLEKEEKTIIAYGLKYKKLCKESEKVWKHNNPSRPVDFFSPMSSEFGRITNQQGLFTFTEDGRSIDAWTEELFKKETKEPILIKINIKSHMRYEFLKNLNVMGINHRTIYPDIEGAAKFCNLGLEIGDGYSNAIVP